MMPEPANVEHGVVGVLREETSARAAIDLERISSIASRKRSRPRAAESR